MTNDFAELATTIFILTQEKIPTNGNAASVE